MTSPSLLRQWQRSTDARRLAILLAILLAAASLPSISHGQLPILANVLSSGDHLQTKGEAQPEAVPGEILVRFAPGSTAKNVTRAQFSLYRSGREFTATIERFEGSNLVEGLRLAHVAPQETAVAIEAFKARPDVLYAEPNYLRHKSDVPNDPRYSEMYGLRLIGAEQAWNTTRGNRDVVVGIVDEGIDINHPDLQANIWQNPGDDAAQGFPGDAHGWDFVNNDNTVFDGAGDASNQTDAHGTHVAGTVGAVGHNGLGVSGVNWQVSLMSIKVLGPQGGDDAAIIRGLSYAKMMRDLWESSGHTRGANVRVLNNSYGGPDFSQSSLDAIRALNDSGILFVAAAGNEGVNNDYIASYPANYDAPNVITVAATDRSDNLASFSNYGLRTVSLAAPGVGILSTTPNNTYGFLSGTSMAAPHVAGAAALLCAASPSVTVARLRAALIYNGDWSGWLTGKVYSNRRLNVANALQSAAKIDVTPPAPASGLSASGTDRERNLRWVAPGDDGTTGRAALYEITFVDGSTGAVSLLATRVPGLAGNQENVFVNLPYRHTNGTIVLKTFDAVGNFSTSSVDATVDPAIAEPFAFSEGGASTISTGGTALGLNADDAYRANYTLPFTFPHAGRPYNTITISTNGALYFSTPPRALDSTPNDLPSSIARLNGQAMIAGLWDDLRTDRRPGDDVYVSQPDANTVVFRWQAVTYDTPLTGGRTRGENPVNFDIELHRDGTVVMHYGDGNLKVFPVVGLSLGEPDAYVAASHTAEYAFTNMPINLTNAPAVTFRPRSHSISGRVTRSDNSFVQVMLSGTRSSLASLDSNGNYVFYGLPQGGNYTVTPVNGSNIYRYTYTPPSRTFNNLLADEVADFTETRIAYSISGRVTDANGIGIAGVTVMPNPLVPGGVTTDADGYYALNNLAAGQSFRVTPSSRDYTFTPEYQNILNLSGNETANFIANPLYNIRGRVIDPNGNGVSGVTLFVSGPQSRSATTDSGGNYLLNGLPAGGNYVVTLSQPGYAFSPATQTFNNLTGNQTLNFTATPVRTIQGRVVDAGGSALAGVTLTLGGSTTATTQTDGGGNYAFGNLPSGRDYTVTAARTFYSFAPASQTFNNLSLDRTANFVGTIAQNTILGQMRDEYGRFARGVSVSLSGSSNLTTQTDDYGYFLFGDLTAGRDYTVTPESASYTFTPQSRNFINFSGPQTANFLATTVKYRIEVSVVDAEGRGIAGVTVFYNGRNSMAAFTDANGQVTLAEQPGGENYFVTPTSSNYTFSPARIDFTNLRSNVSARFVATPLPKTVQFTFPNNPVYAYNGHVDVYVNRSGDTSGTATVDYATVDNPAAVACNDTTTMPGVAFARCDYATTVGTLTFAAGESVKFFSIPIIPTSYVKPTLTFAVRLLRPSGAALGALAQTTVVITSNNAPGLRNPVFTTPFFIRMHYLDFLSREPEPGEPWSAVLNRCADLNNTDPNSPSSQCDRILVSQSFFGSPEFRLKGFYVFRFYKLAFNRLPEYVEIIPDMSFIAGATPAEVYQRKAQLSANITQLPAFQATYGTLSNTEFVNTLLGKYQLTQITTPDPTNPDGELKVTLTSGDLISRLNGTAGALTRAQVFRAVADSDQVGAAEFNNAFVAMQYYGYLRRTPEAQGYQAWLNYLNAHPTDSRTMVNGFMNSTEYRLRFGNPNQ